MHINIKNEWKPIENSEKNQFKTEKKYSEDESKQVMEKIVYRQIHDDFPATQFRAVIN